MSCYAKFAAVRPGRGAGDRFARLLGAWESFAASRGLSRLFAGVNTARKEAYSALLDRGFKTLSLGVAMHRGDDVAWNRPGAYVLDVWR